MRAHFTPQHWHWRLCLWVISVRIRVRLITEKDGIASIYCSIGPHVFIHGVLEALHHIQARASHHASTSSLVCTTFRHFPRPSGLRNARAPTLPRSIGLCGMWGCTAPLVHDRLVGAATVMNHTQHVLSSITNEAETRRVIILVSGLNNPDLPRHKELTLALGL